MPEPGQAAFAKLLGELANEDPAIKQMLDAMNGSDDDSELDEEEIRKIVQKDLKEKLLPLTIVAEEVLKTVLENKHLIKQLIQILTGITRETYLAHIANGFTEEQAFQLISGKNSAQFLSQLIDKISD